jgi:hypothetical protein
MPTFTNGFTEYAAGRVFLDFKTTALNYAPYGTRFNNIEQTWGYGKTDTTGLPTPQAHSSSVEAATEKINFLSNSSPFDILLNDATNIVIYGVQLLDSSNNVLLETPVSSNATFIYDGEFTILSGSAVDFGTNTSFYAK